MDCLAVSKQDMQSSASDPAGVVEFVKIIPAGRLPKRADRSGAGSLPGRAMRYCDALTSATGYGYWLFPPMDLQLLWDGEQIFWSCDGATTWQPLSGTETGAIQFPDFADAFDSLAPAGMAGLSPPFLTALPEAGTVQIWTGLLARTKPGWSLNVRSPVNLPPIAGLTAWEGLIETDHWFGPLFTNFRITKTDCPVYLRAQTPFIQVQPVPQIAYHEMTLHQFVVRDVTAMTAQDWHEFARVLRPDEGRGGQGNYAVRARKRRSCPRQAIIRDGVLAGSVANAGSRQAKC